MSNTIVYTVSLNDMMSGKLQHIESNIDRLEKKLASLGKTGGLGQDFGAGLKAHSIAAGVAFGNAAYDVIKTGARMIVDSTRELINLGKERQLLRTDINTLAGTSGPALFSQLKEYEQNSLFGPKVFEHAKEMLGFGFKSGEVMPMIKALGEISGGNEERMQRLEYAASELRSGDVTFRHIRQLMQAGLPLQDLAERFKMTASRFKEAVSNQELTGKQITDAILKIANDPHSRFYGRMEKLMDTGAGKLVQLTTNFSEWKNTLGEKLLESQGFKDLFNSFDRLFTKAPEFTDKIVKFFSDLLELLSRLADRFQKFVENGGLDKVINSLSFIANNFEKLALLYAGGKGLSMVGGGGSALGISALGISEFLTPALIALVVAETVDLIGTNYGWFGQKTSGGKTLWDLLGVSDWGVSPEGLSANKGIDWTRSDVKPNSEYDKNYLIEQKAIQEWGGINNIRYDRLGFPVSKDLWDKQQNKIMNDMNLFTAPIPGLDFINGAQLLQKPTFLGPLKGAGNLYKKGDSANFGKDAGDAAASKVHGPKNTNVYITINGGFGNFDITNTSSDGNFLSGSNRQKIRDEIIELLEESVNDGIAKAGK